MNRISRSRMGSEGLISALLLVDEQVEVGMEPPANPANRLHCSTNRLPHVRADMPKPGTGATVSILVTHILATW